MSGPLFIGQRRLFNELTLAKCSDFKAYTSLNRTRLNSANNIAGFCNNSQSSVRQSTNGLCTKCAYKTWH